MEEKTTTNVVAELGDRTDVYLRYNRSSWDDTLGVGDRLNNQITPYDTFRTFNPIGQLVTTATRIPTTAAAAARRRTS